MPYNEVSRKKTNTKRDLTGTAVQLKHLMNDIIDVAYKDKDPATLTKLKRFTITCSDRVKQTVLGHCKYSPGLSEIMIYSMENEGVKPALITTIHETAHHASLILYKETGHGDTFYRVHKRLLFAAFDMGILAPEDIGRSNNHSRNREKLAKMMGEYVPHPVEYKTDVAHISVYNAYNIRNQLRARGYKWNPLELAWVLETKSDKIDAALDYLRGYLHVKESDISVAEGDPILLRQRTNIYLYEVQFDQNQIVKDLGYHWVTRGKDKFWTKKISGDRLPEEETKYLLSLGIDIYTHPK